MELGLKGRHVAILAADGVNEGELAAPRAALSGVGAAIEVLAPKAKSVRGSDGGAISVDHVLGECHAADYDALIVPGGRAAVDTLSSDQQAVQFLREFMAADKPVAIVGDGVRLLVAADAVAGRVIAAASTVTAEVRQAGGDVVDADVHVDEKLITARGGDVSRVILREFADRVDEARVDALSEQSFPASDPPPGPVAVGGEGATTTARADGSARTETGQSS